MITFICTYVFIFAYVSMCHKAYDEEIQWYMVTNPGMQSFSGSCGLIHPTVMLFGRGSKRLLHVNDEGRGWGVGHDFLGTPGSATAS